MSVKIVTAVFPMVTRSSFPGVTGTSCVNIFSEMFSAFSAVGNSLKQGFSGFLDVAGTSFPDRVRTVILAKRSLFFRVNRIVPESPTVKYET